MRKGFPDSGGPLSVNRPEPVMDGNAKARDVGGGGPGTGRTNHGGVVREWGPPTAPYRKPADDGHFD
jgi:hypothetical protein